MPHNYKYLNLVGLLNSLNWLRNVIVISFRIYTVLRAIKQTRASVHKVRRSIEDKLLSSQETTRKRAEHEDLLLKREQLCAEVTWRTASVNKMKDQADQLHRSNQEQGRVLWQNFASVICTKCSSVEIWFLCFINLPFSLHSLIEKVQIESLLFPFVILLFWDLIG